jgi:hypothetical protein
VRWSFWTNAETRRVSTKLSHKNSKDIPDKPEGISYNKHKQEANIENP